MRFELVTVQQAILSGIREVRSRGIEWEENDLEKRSRWEWKKVCENIRKRFGRRKNNTHVLHNAHKPTGKSPGTLRVRVQNVTGLSRYKKMFDDLNVSFRLVRVIIIAIGSFSTFCFTLRRYCKHHTAVSLGLGVSRVLFIVVLFNFFFFFQRQQTVPIKWSFICAHKGFCIWWMNNTRCVIIQRILRRYTVCSSEFYLNNMTGTNIGFIFIATKTLRCLNLLPT